MGFASLFQHMIANPNAPSKPITVTGNKAFLALNKPRYKTNIGKTDNNIKVFITCKF
jgi:hypothetical protein